MAASSSLSRLSQLAPFGAGEVGGGGRFVVGIGMNV